MGCEGFIQLGAIPSSDPGTLGWELVFDGDFAGVTPATQSGSGSGTIVGGDFDGLPYKWADNASNGGQVVLSTDGLKADGGSGSVGSTGADIDVSTLIAPEDEDDFVAVLFVDAIANVNGSSKGVRVGVSATGQLTAAVCDGMKATYQSSGNWLPNIMKDDATTTSYAGTQAIATSGRLIVRVLKGMVAWSNWAPAETDLPDAAEIAACYAHQASYSAKASARYSTTLWVGVNGIFNAEVELYRVAIYRKEVV